MKKLISLIVLALVAGPLAGCGGNSPTGSGGSSGSNSNPTTSQGSPEDRADVVAAAAGYPEFMEDALYESGLTMTNQIAGDGSSISIETAIQPITFTRRVRVTARQFEFAFADTDTTGRPTSALLTVHRDLSGTLRISAVDTTGSFNAPVRIEKPITEQWTRRLQFARDSSGNGDGDGDDDDKDKDKDKGKGGRHLAGGRGHDHDRGKGRWVLAAVSGVEVGTPDGAVDIVSLRIVTAGLDTTITDPLALWPVNSLPALPPQTQVTITVTTQAADDIVLLLARDRRFRLQPNGVNSYTGTFTVPASRSAQHYGVTALSNQTLFDSVAPYDSETWIWPVRTRNAPLVSSR